MTDQLQRRLEEAGGDEDALQSLHGNLLEQCDALRAFMAWNDARLVRKATKGIGTDEELLIKVLCNRSKAQLQLIDEAMQAAGDRPLKEVVDSEVGGTFNRLLVNALTPKAEFDAGLIDKACRGIGTNEELLTEIFTTRKNDEVAAMRGIWEGMHDANLTDYLNSELSGTFRQIVLKLLNDGRNESEVGMEGAAAEQAAALHEAGVGNMFGTDEQCFIDILCPASRPEIESIKAIYESEYDMSLERAIEKEFSGDARDALINLLYDRTDIFCRVLNKAVKGLGTDEEVVSRVLGGNDVVYVQQICARYEEKYGTSMVEVLDSELSGNAKKACITFVSGSDYTNGVQELNRTDVDDLQARCESLIVENTHTRSAIALLDADRIRKACKGIGTAEDEVINVVCHRTKDQLQAIDAVYRSQFGTTLAEELDSEIGFNTGDFLANAVQGEATFAADQIKRACGGLGTDEELLISICVPRTPAQLAKIKEFYEARNDSSLTDLLTSELSGPLCDLLLNLFNGERDWSDEIDDGDAEAAADTLHAAAEGLGTDESAVIEIFSTNGPARLKKIDEVYQSKYEESLENLVEGEFSGDDETCLLAMLDDPVEYHCKALKEAMEGLGTDEKEINRIIGGRNKSHTRRVAERFEEKYGESLMAALDGELSGNHKIAVQHWIQYLDPTAGAEEAGEEEAAQADEDDDSPLDASDDEEGDDNEDEDEEEKGVDDEELDEELVAKLLAEELGEGDDDDDEDEDGDGDDDDDDGDGQGRRRRKAQRRKRREEKRRKNRRRQRRKKSNKGVSDEKRARARAQIIRRLRRQKRKDLERQRRQRQGAKHNKMQQCRKVVLDRVKTRNERSRRRLQQWANRGTRLPRGVVIYGKWSDEGYLFANPDVAEAGDDPWEHFSTQGYNQGRLMCVTNKWGTFVGALNPGAYLDRNGLEQPSKKKAPFHPNQAALRHFRTEGKDADADLALSPANMVSAAGHFSSGLYYQANKDAKAFKSKPRPGTIDLEKYLELNPDVDPDDEPMKHYAKKGFQKGELICVRKRYGVLDRNWYRRKYRTKKTKKHLVKHLKKHNWKPSSIRLKVEGKAMNGREHFIEFGHGENRPVRIWNRLGVFQGEFDAEGYARLNPDASGDAFEHWSNEGGPIVIGGSLRAIRYFNAPAGAADDEDDPEFDEDSFNSDDEEDEDLGDEDEFGESDGDDDDEDDD